MFEYDEKPALSDADKYRLNQARELLREAGFVEHPDGTWHEPTEQDEARR